MDIYSTVTIRKGKHVSMGMLGPYVPTVGGTSVFGQLNKVAVICFDDFGGIIGRTIIYNNNLEILMSLIR
jgi:hypothetical protein